MVYLFRKILAALLSFVLSVTGFVAKPQKPMAEFYVSVYGSDSNTGEKDSPFASLQKARDEVRKINGNMTGDIVVHIMQPAIRSHYRLEELWQHPPARTGAQAAR